MEVSERERQRGLTLPDDPELGCGYGSLKWNYLFGQACRVHDRDYERGDSETRAEVDSRFSRNVARIIRATPFPQKIPAYLVGKLYTQIVYRLGGLFW